MACALITEDMFDSGANPRAPVVGRLLPLVQLALAAALAVNAALVTFLPELLLARFSAVRPSGESPPCSAVGS